MTIENNRSVRIYLEYLMEPNILYMESRVYSSEAYHNGFYDETLQRPYGRLYSAYWCM